MKYLMLVKAVRSAGNGVGTLVDIITIQAVHGKENKGEGYGNQRLWTGVAWGVGSFATGLLIDSFGFDAIFVWTYSGVAALFMLMCAVPGNSYRSAPATSSTEAEKPKLSICSSVSALKQLWQLALVGVLYGIAMTLVEHIMFLQLD